MVNTTLMPIRMEPRSHSFRLRRCRKPVLGTGIEIFLPICNGDQAVTFKIYYSIKYENGICIIIITFWTAHRVYVWCCAAFTLAGAVNIH